MFEGRVRASAAYRAAPWILAVAVAIMPFAASGQAQVSAQMGVGTAPPPKLVELSAVPQMGARELAALAARPKPLRPQNGLSDQQYAALKAVAARRRFDIPNVQPMSPPAEPAVDSIPADAGTAGVLTPGATSSFNGNFETPCGNFAPADMGLAVGDGQPVSSITHSPIAVLQVNNACISVFDKLGNLQAGYPKSLASFAGVSASAFLFDPRALYDWVNHRYIVSFAEFDATSGTTVGSYWVAVSAGDDPTGSYFLYNLPSHFGAAVLTDFPRLGQDRQGIYVASNVFGATLTTYFGEEWLLLPKQRMYAGLTLTYNSFFGHTVGGLLTDSSQPANVWSLTDNPRAEFFVTSLNINFGGGHCITGCNGLAVWAVSNPLVAAGSPGAELSGVFIPTAFDYSLPPSAVQFGTTDVIDTGDVRISGEVSYAAGSLYAALTTNNGGGGAGAILYKIRPVLNDGNPGCTGAFQFLCADIAGATILNESFLNYGNINSAYYPTQQPDPEGNVTTVFNFSSPLLYAGSDFISTRVTQAPGTFRDGGNPFFVGTNFYPQFRWGDYTGVAPSGINGNTPTPQMWFSGMYTNGSGNWNTGIGKNGFTAPNQP